MKRRVNCTSLFSCALFGADGCSSALHNLHKKPHREQADWGIPKIKSHTIMTHPIYTLEQLQAKNRNELWVICRFHGLKCYPSKSDCVDAIALSQPQKLEDLSPSDTKVEAEIDDFAAEECTITPVAKTDVQTAYNVRSNGLLIGLIFHVRNTSWQCGDGRHYANPVDAIAALQKITGDSPSLIMISNPISGFGKYQTPDGEIEARQQGELSPREKLWKNNKDEYYYSTHMDAVKQINPVAVQARDLNVGDKVRLNDGCKTIKKIRGTMFHGLRGMELVMDGCDSIKTIWFNPVRIA